MSKTTIALESAVAVVIANMPKDVEGRGTPRQRHEVDKAFARIMKLIAPRVRHFIRQYGLAGHWEDAEQVCAIAVHRAIQAYDPAKAQFTTFVNWQIRGELQSLRFRLMTDQRPSAQKVDATTVSINSIATGPEGDQTTLEGLIQDENAHITAEAGASDYLATSALQALIDSYIEHLRAAAIEQLKRRPRPKRRPVQADSTPAPYLRSSTHGIEPEELESLEQRLRRDREIIHGRLLDIDGSESFEANGISKERARQIAKRAIKTIGEIAGSHEKYKVMADYRKVGVLRSRARSIKLESGGAPASPAPLTVVLPDTVRPRTEWPLIAEEDFDRAAIEAAEAAGAVVQAGSQLRH
ncbi:MAG: sigma-70 family RNA polymerase sigma factor [Sphingomonas oligoaromativorans]